MAEKNGSKPGAERPVVRPQPIPPARMVPAAFVIGDIQNLTLVEDETIEEGLQDVERFRHIGPRLAVNQWIVVGNDAGSVRRVMIVEKLHCHAGSGLRALFLRDLFPPRIFDIEHEPIIATGDWYVRYGGPHRRWMVITPSGTIRREGINTEVEAKRQWQSESGNPAPI